MSGGLPFYAPAMPVGQPQGGYPQGGYAPTGYVQNSHQPAVPARAGGIPVLSTAVARGARGEEPSQPRAAAPQAAARQAAAPQTAAAPRSPAPQASAAPRSPAPAGNLVASRTVAIPTPEEVGVSGASTVKSSQETLDWAATQRALNELGAERFEMAKLPTGGSRFSCWVRDGSGLRPIQARGSTDAEAVRLCLALARSR